MAERAEDRARFHARIATDIARLETLIAGVREVTRVDAGLEADERRPIDLAALVRERAGEGAGVTLTVTGGAPIVVDASADRLGQVLDNLLDNARSFSPPGAAIDVDVAPVERGGPRPRPRPWPRHPGRARSAASSIASSAIVPTRPTRGRSTPAWACRSPAPSSSATAVRSTAATHPGGGAVFELTLPLA